MGKYLPYKEVGGTIAVGICDRCKVKHYLGDLNPDINSPGLMVCDGCSDLKDTYRLPARRVEDISLKHIRKDEDLV